MAKSHISPLVPTPADGEDDDVGDSLGGADPDNSVVATFLLHWLDRVETEGSGGGGGGVRSGRDWDGEGSGGGGAGSGQGWEGSRGEGSKVGGVRRERVSKGRGGSRRGQEVEEGGGKVAKRDEV